MESSHLFGGPEIFDRLPDTPEEDDDSWLMHYSPRGEAVSTWQGFVARANPWVCHDTAGPGGP